MTKPAHPLTPDYDIGPLDENGQQIWSFEEEAAIARMNADPEYLAGVARAEADILAGRVFTMDEVRARSRERRRKWFMDTGRATPSSYRD